MVLDKDNKEINNLQNALNILDDNHQKKVNEMFVN